MTFTPWPTIDHDFRKPNLIFLWLLGAFSGHPGTPKYGEKSLSGARNRHLRYLIFKKFPSGGQRHVAGPRCAYRRTPLFFFCPLPYAFFNVHSSNYHEYDL